MKKRISIGAFKKRLKAGDPESVRLMNEFVETLRRESQPLVEWWEKMEENPDTAKQLRYLETLSEYSDPDWRRIGENIDIESFVELMNQARDEEERIELPALVDTPIHEDHATTNTKISNLYNEENMREVKELSLKKWTIRDISRKIGISVSTVKRYRKIQGIRRRKS